MSGFFQQLCFVVFSPRPSPFLLFLLPPISTSPLTLAALGARETRGLLAGDFCCPAGSWQGWLIPNILPCDPEWIPPIQGQGWGLSLPQSQPAPCLLPSEHRSRRDETKPYRSHCLSDYKVPLIEGATNARKRLCWTSILAQIKLQVGISLIVPDSDKYSSTVRRQPACPGQGKVASVLWEGTCVHWELLGGARGTLRIAVRQEMGIWGALMQHTHHRALTPVSVHISDCSHTRGAAERSIISHWHGSRPGCFLEVSGSGIPDLCCNNLISFHRLVATLTEYLMLCPVPSSRSLWETHCCCQMWVTRGCWLCPISHSISKPKGHLLDHHLCPSPKQCSCLFSGQNRDNNVGFEPPVQWELSSDSSVAMGSGLNHLALRL